MRVAIFLVVLCGCTPSIAQQALVRARSGNALYYARSYTYDADKIVINECNRPIPRSLEREKFVVFEGVNVCARVSFGDQLATIRKAYSLAIKSTGETANVRISIPQLNNEQRAAIQALAAEVKVPTHVRSGGEFRIRLAIPSGQHREVVARAKAITESFATSSPEEFLELVRTEKSPTR